MEKPVVIRLFPENRSLFCVVKVWRTKKAYAAGLLRDHGKAYAKAHGNAGAVAGGRDIWRIFEDGRKRKTPKFAEINFRRDCLDTEVLVHEIGHVMHRWADRISLSLDERCPKGVRASDTEERYCYALGRMVAQLNNAFHKRGIWRSLDKKTQASPGDH